MNQQRSVRVLIGIAAFAGLFTFLFISLRYGLAQRHMDLDGYLVAAKVLRTGGNPYDFAQTGAMHALYGTENMPMTSPLPLPISYIPFSYLPLRVAGMIWALGCAICYAGAVAVLLKAYCRSAAVAAGIIFLAGIQSSYPLSASLGQISPLIFFLIALAVTSAERKRYVTCAILIAIATLLKAYPIALLPVLWWRDRRALAIGLGAVVVGFLAPALFVPDGVFGESWRMVFSQTKVINTWGQNQCLPAMWHRLLTQTEYYNGIVNSPSLANTATKITTVVGFLIWLAACVRYQKSASTSLLFGFSVLTCLAFASIIWEHYLMHSIVAVAVLFCVPRIVDKMPPALMLLAIIGSGIVALPFDYLRTPLATGIFTLFISAKLFGIIALWFVSLRMLSPSRT